LGIWQVGALAAGAVLFVMRMLFQPLLARADHGAEGVTSEAQLVAGPAEVGIVTRSMHVVTVVAGDPLQVHPALHEVVPLHPILVTRSVREMG